MNIIFNPEWQLDDDPAEFEIDKDGKIDFGEDQGLLRLPQDYLDFMAITNGAVLIGDTKKSYFIIRFRDGTDIWPLDELYYDELVVSQTDAYQDGLYYDEKRCRIPPGYVTIANVNSHIALICAIEGHEDYGKIYGWRFSQDPWMEGNNTFGLGYIADSFTAFMNNLEVEEAL